MDMDQPNNQLALPGTQPGAATSVPTGGHGTQTTVPPGLGHGGTGRPAAAATRFTQINVQNNFGSDSFEADNMNVDKVGLPDLANTALANQNAIAALGQGLASLGAQVEALTTNMDGNVRLLCEGIAQTSGCTLNVTQELTRANAAAAQAPPPPPPAGDGAAVNIMAQALQELVALNRVKEANAGVTRAITSNRVTDLMRFIDQLEPPMTWTQYAPHQAIVTNLTNLLCFWRGVGHGTAGRGRGPGSPPYLPTW